MGAQDRKFISNVVWNILRHREKFRWHLNNINAEITTENEVILELYFLDEKYKKNITKIKNLFIIKYSDYKVFADNHFNFLNNLSSLSLKTPPSINSKNKLFDKDFI